MTVHTLAFDRRERPTRLRFAAVSRDRSDLPVRVLRPTDIRTAAGLCHAVRCHIFHSDTCPFHSMFLTAQVLYRFYFFCPPSVFFRSVFGQSNILHPQPVSCQLLILFSLRYCHRFFDTSINSSHNDPKSIPTAAASCGRRLVGVMPGSVFASRQYRFSSPSIMKSILP